MTCVVLGTVHASTVRGNRGHPSYGRTGSGEIKTTSVLRSAGLCYVRMDARGGIHSQALQGIRRSAARKGAGLLPSAKGPGAKFAYGNGQAGWRATGNSNIYCSSYTAMAIPTHSKLR